LASGFVLIVLREEKLFLSHFYEVVLREGDNMEHGTGIDVSLMDRLGIRKRDLVGESYIHLLRQGKSVVPDDDERF
jgi:hypothetical protein